MADASRTQTCPGRDQVTSRAAASLPRISAARLQEATADGCHGPVLAAEYDRTGAFPQEKRPAMAGSAQADTVLYLAYGSNMAAATFEGMRGIRPLARTSVSVPTLDLVFDLPGVPYFEPCFANTALRKRVPKIPDRPPKLPPVPVPDPPAPPGGPAVPPPEALRERTPGAEAQPAQRPDARAAAHGDPIWTGGLYAVVYEVTPQDFATILATEGGGSSYQDVLVPCLALPPAITIPEKPPLPDPPRPFFAHTLWAPQRVDKPLFSARGEVDGDDDGNDDDKDAPWLRRRWRALRRSFLRLALTGVRRPDAAYAQPSARYLQLLVDGARENELPPAYQAWLAALAAYRITTCRQRVGRALLLLVAVLPVASGMAAMFLWGKRGKGRPPLWLLAAVHAQLWIIWWLYDTMFKPVFGDGERTMVADDTARRTVKGAATRQDEETDEELVPTWPTTRRPSMLPWTRGPAAETTPLCWHSGDNV